MFGFCVQSLGQLGLWFSFFFFPKNFLFGLLKKKMQYLVQNRDSAKHMSYHFFQSPNFIDSDLVLNKTQNTKQREGIDFFKRDSPWVLRWEADDQADLELLYSFVETVLGFPDAALGVNVVLEWWRWWRPCCWYHFRRIVIVRREGGMGRAACGGDKGRFWRERERGVEVVVVWIWEWKVWEWKEGYVG